MLLFICTFCWANKRGDDDDGEVYGKYLKSLKKQVKGRYLLWYMNNIMYLLLT